MDVSVERSVCGVEGEGGVLWRLVRMSSRGEAMDVTSVRAVIPAVRGTSGAGSNGGRVSFRR